MTVPSSPSEAVLRQATELLKAGNKQEAKPLIVEGLRLDPRSIQGWYLAIAATEDRNKQIRALEHILKLSPGDQQAQQMLDERLIEVKDRVKNRVGKIHWNEPAAPATESAPATAPAPNAPPDQLDEAFYGLLGDAPMPSQISRGRRRARGEGIDPVAVLLVIVILVVLVAGVLLIYSMVSSSTPAVATAIPTLRP